MGPSNSSNTGSGNSASKKRHHRNFKGLVDYTSEVSSEDFSGPEDGEVDSDSGTRINTSPPLTAPPKLPIVAPSPPSQVDDTNQISKQPKSPLLVANASPINDDEDDIDLGGNREVEQPQTPPEPLETEEVSPSPFDPP